MHLLVHAGSFAGPYLACKCRQAVLLVAGAAAAATRCTAWRTYSSSSSAVLTACIGCEGKSLIKFGWGCGSWQRLQAAAAHRIALRRMQQEAEIGLPVVSAMDCALPALATTSFRTSGRSPCLKPWCCTVPACLDLGRHAITCRSTAHPRLENSRRICIKNMHG